MFAHLLNRLNLVGVNQAKLEKCVKILKLALMRPIKLNNKIGFTLLSLWLLFFFILSHSADAQLVPLKTYKMESLVTIAGIWKGEIPEQQLKLEVVSYCYKALHLRCLRRSWLRRCSLVKYLFRVIFKILEGNKVDGINDF